MKEAPEGWIKLSNYIVKVYPKKENKKIAFHLTTNLLIHTHKPFSSFAYLKSVKAFIILPSGEQIEFDRWSFAEGSSYKFNGKIMVVDFHFLRIMEYRPLQTGIIDLNFVLGFSFPKGKVEYKINSPGLLRKMYEELMWKK